MGLRTSVYLTDELNAMWRASRLPLAEVIRRGLAAGGPVDEITMRHAVREIIREELSGLSAAADGAPASYGAREYEREAYLEDP